MPSQKAGRKCLKILSYEGAAARCTSSMMMRSNASAGHLSSSSQRLIVCTVAKIRAARRFFTSSPMRKPESSLPKIRSKLSLACFAI